MPLTWWLQADTHFDEDDPFQQNLLLTLQALTAEKKEEDHVVNITIHKEIEPEVNVIFDAQIDNWLDAGMIKTLIFTTGKGDILLRQLFTTAATSFVEAQMEATKLKEKLEEGYFDQFNLNPGPDFLHVSMLGMNDFSTPGLRIDVNKPLVLLISTQDYAKYPEIAGNFIKDCVFHLRDYRTSEVSETIANFYADNVGFEPNVNIFDLDDVRDIDLLQLFE
ncbi:hypothetical protein SPSAdV-1_gp22 [Skua adenovirus 1]|uniref:Uncharacterized protein n=1 Tax=South Polar skua adenovirus 1 TaxID=2848087 RepID=G9B6L6_9ADEN|nr:hypothetical protein SPSAdV-1_gp22 [Skua adenovirus 1]ADP30832.1 hypothetical protein [Skua adenovirus 1]